MALRSVLLFCLSALPVLASGDEYPIHPWGFEVGNGRQIENPVGKYGMKVPGQMEVGFVDQFTEVITPLSEGTPRTRLQIDVVKSAAAPMLDNGAHPVRLGSLDGVASEERFVDGRREVRIQLNRSTAETVVLTLEGRPGTKAYESFQAIVSNLKTFESLAH